ncbi:MAG: phosphotransferase [Candidatus Hodarchaeales archaeon]|jgi:aminoglycoside 2''-phosphotransferase
MASYTPDDLTSKTVKRILENAFPYLSITSPKYIGGESCRVYETNEGLIFRFPRVQDVESDVRKEIKLLKYLTQHLSLSIPKVEFLAKSNLYPYLIVGYNKIPGVSMFKIKNTNFEHLKTWARDLGLFLSQLHSISLEELKKNALIEEIPTQSQYQNQSIEFYNEIKELVYPFLRKTEIQWSKNYFESFIYDKQNFQFNPCLVHGDFDDTNILVNSKTNNISGIIDFESHSVYDPVADIVILYYEFGSKFLEDMISHYKYPIEKGIEKRMEIYWNRCPYYYLSAGKKNNLQEIWLEGKKMLKERMSTS